ncbi:MAG: GntR family transcriptional regulator [Paracoccus denitrificans]|uniref:GntR family transcriptional regulator n=1 Tax=Paracoccus denitrificans TaxID=266 RepID=A0A533I2D0_PARDE|nr:MAG: GntR family transcriptional regulator [Paracoccus denitrificans]
MTISQSLPDTANPTVGDTVLQQIRADIIRGVLQPGQRLRLARLRQAYGASITTLREMLSRLVSERYVIAEGQRGFEVAPVSVPELRELADMRILLESHALRRSIKLGALEWEASVVSAHHMLHSVESRLIGGAGTPVEKWVEYDWSFHHATISACDMPALMDTHRNIFERYLRYHMLTLEFRGDLARKDHDRMAELVVARDADGAIELLTHHIQAGRDYIIASGKLSG